eukprot:TRINITY_DN8225_c0_g1_i1.p1 TRINITY_DN8225_c0_g1~~TRINITY_DN8225_c0_g1_i1.p1  ORF type:complete len:190 (-),score=30.97 TRINITY_DN8225_c0_g1_i1:361-930(-)
MASSFDLPWRYVAALIVVTVAGKSGDVLGPVLAAERPLALLVLNSNDLHLSLTVAGTSICPWLLIGTLRRTVEDPLFFLIGWYYREKALRWLQERWQIKTADIEAASSRFARISAAAVFVEPGAVVCTLAGAARMAPWWFATLNVFGTLARLVFIRSVAVQWSGPVQAISELAAAGESTTASGFPCFSL